MSGWIQRTLQMRGHFIVPVFLSVKIMMGEAICIDDIAGTESFLNMALPHMVLLANKRVPHSKQISTDIIYKLLITPLLQISTRTCAGHCSC